MPYKNIGLVPAKMDDVMNFLPARLSALIMLAAGWLLKLDARNGWKIFKRDRFNHASPNSAQTESVCAGLLGLRLAGDAWYHGVLHKKKYIGDALREIDYNPTGKIVDAELMKQILMLCKQNGTCLFVDECFLDLSDSGESLKQYLANYRNLFILKAFTKSYGMAGIRLGYCMSSDSELLEKMSQSTQPWNVSSIAQAAGVAALQEKAFLQKTKDLIVVERQWLKRELEELGFRVCPSSVNYLLFQAPTCLHTKLRAKKIAIRNCDNYVGLGPGWYRIAVRLHEENEMLIRAIKEV